MALPFQAHCQRGHDRIDFTDRAAFEQHMVKTHKAKKLRPGGAGGFTPAYYHQMPAADAPRRGGLPNKYLHPSKAPKGTAGLTKVLAAAAAEYVNHGHGVGSVHPILDDWQTDERVTLADVRTGDVFLLGRHEYTCADREAWLVTGPGAETPTRPRNIDDRLAESVVIVKRAA